MTKSREAFQNSEERYVQFGLVFGKERGAKEILEHELARLIEETSTLTAYLADQEVLIAAMQQEGTQHQKMAEMLRATSEADSGKSVEKLRVVESQHQMAVIKLEEAKNQMEKLQGQVEEMEEKQRNTENILQRTLSSLDKAEREIAAFRDQVENERQQVVKLTEASVVAEAERNQLTKTVHRLRTKISELTNEIKVHFEKADYSHTLYNDY